MRVHFLYQQIKFNSNGARFIAILKGEPTEELVFLHTNHPRDLKDGHRMHKTFYAFLHRNGVVDLDTTYSGRPTVIKTIRVKGLPKDQIMEAGELVPMFPHMIPRAVNHP